MIVGIDLGTTNSLVGIWRDGAATLIPNSLGPHGPAASARSGTVGNQKDRETLADGWI
jgi:molecular chaperone DnaK (HSP70)